MLLQGLSTEQLEQTVTVVMDDEAFAIDDCSIIKEDDVLDAGHFYLRVAPPKEFSSILCRK